MGFTGSLVAWGLDITVFADPGEVLPLSSLASLEAVVAPPGVPAGDLPAGFLACWFPGALECWFPRPAAEGACLPPALVGVEDAS